MARAQAVVLSEERGTVKLSADVCFASAQAPTPFTPTTVSSCGYCGRSHAKGKRNCPAAGRTCDRCGKKDHFREVCKAQLPAQQQRFGPGRADTSSRAAENMTRSTAALTTTPAANASARASASARAERDTWAETYAVTKGKTGFVLPLRDIQLDGRHTLKMHVDSGSLATVLQRSRVPPGYVLTKAPCDLKPMGTRPIKPLGVFEADLHFGSKTVRETMFVVDDHDEGLPTLLREGASISLGLLAGPEVPVGIVTENPNASEPLCSDQSEALPAMKGPVHIHLDPDVTPVQQSAR